MLLCCAGNWREQMGWKVNNRLYTKFALDFCILTNSFKKKAPTSLSRHLPGW
jgi:hypothetical protein